MSAELGKDIEDKKASIGSNPSKEDEQKIQTLQKQQTKKFLEARKDINERRAKEISEIRQSYIDDILSMAQIIAHEHGAHIILKAVSIFWPDDSVDITDEVISRMMESKHASSVEGEQNITELNE